MLGTDILTGSSQPVPSSPQENSANPPRPLEPSEETSGRLGPGCQSSDPGHLCLALKYVVYEDADGRPIVSEQAAVSNLEEINRIWSTCDIGFQIDEFLVVRPEERNLSFNTPTYTELTEIRDTFLDQAKLVLTTTGEWSGELGAGAANAWATMPGSGPYGVVLEEPVARHTNILAHELGHYLNLDHVSDPSDLMSPVVYSTSTSLASWQCEEARAAVNYHWKPMLR